MSLSACACPTKASAASSPRWLKGNQFGGGTSTSWRGPRLSALEPKFSAAMAPDDDRPALEPAPLTHHGYRTGCVCLSCMRREREVRAGRLYYYPHGKLRTRRAKAPGQPWGRPQRPDSAGRHVRCHSVGRVAIEVVPSAVVPPRGARVGVTGGILHIAQRRAGIERRRHE